MDTFPLTLVNEQTKDWDLRPLTSRITPVNSAFSVSNTSDQSTINTVWLRRMLQRLPELTYSEQILVTIGHQHCLGHCQHSQDS